MSAAPKIAVVGHPNKGKSSLVSTLAQDDSVFIAPQSGSTIVNQSFPLRIDSKVLYTLIDTPGFQRPRQTYEWLEAHADNTADRIGALRAFIESFKDDARFHAETQLLSPIVNNGAGVIYVIDGSLPYGPEYEVEMKILRWTGQPSMALINSIGPGDYVEEWRTVLNQYFKIVRSFNPLNASFEDRIALLRGFSHLDERWQKSLECAVNGLLTQRHLLTMQSAEIIAQLLITSISHIETCKLGIDAQTEEKEQAEKDLEYQFRQAIVEAEDKALAQITALYQHHHLQLSPQQTHPLLEKNLFSSESWQIFGLDKQQLLTTSVAGGAIAGGIVDLTLLGSSLFLGAGIGAATAGLTSMFAPDKLAKIKILGSSVGKLELKLGPVKNRNFPYVLLNRALQFHALTQSHSHADRSSEPIIFNEAKLKDQTLKDRIPYEKLFTQLGSGKDLNADQQEKLVNLVLSRIQLLNAPSNDENSHPS